MSGGEVSHAGFTREMYRLLRDFAREVEVHPLIYRGLKVTLGATRAPRHSADRRLWVADEQGPSSEGMAHAGHHFAYPLRLCRTAAPDDILLAEAGIGDPAQGLCQLGVVA